MNITTLASIIAGLFLIVYICYKQTTWRPVSLASMGRLIVMMGGIGLLILFSGKGTITQLDVALAAIEFSISLISGMIMGSIAIFRPLNKPVRVNKKGHMAYYESRTGWVGIVLWLLVIATRVAIGVFAQIDGAYLVDSAGMIFLLLAMNRAGRMVVFSRRLDRLSAGPARS